MPRITIKYKVTEVKEVTPAYYEKDKKAYIQSTLSPLDGYGSITVREELALRTLYDVTIDTDNPVPFEIHEKQADV